MKTYRHPKLGRVARRKEIRYEDNIHRYEIGKTCFGMIVFVDDNITYTIDELLALGFEEVKEEKENDETTYGSDCNITTNEENDRIYNVFNEFCDKKRQDIRDFRNVIERYLPKNKKPTKSEVAIYCYRTKNIVLEQPMIDFLRDHDLLEE